MPTLEEVRGRGNVDGLERIDGNRVHILWDTIWYDGPIDGVAAYRDDGGAERRCYFTLQGEHDDEAGKPHQVFLLLEITKEQFDREEYTNNIVREYREAYREAESGHGDLYEIGGDLDEIGDRLLAANEDYAKLDYQSNNVLGWFEW